MYKFEYPLRGQISRKTGEGCSACVHSTYCPALHYYRQFQKSQPDPEIGTACASWSNNKADIVDNYPPTPEEMADNEYNGLHHILCDPNDLPQMSPSTYNNF